MQHPPTTVPPLVFDFEGAAAIPVGHHIDITVFEPDGGEPGVLITDRTTGVVYAPWWLYERRSMIVREGPRPHELRTDLRVRGRVQARVLRCRVLMTRQHSKSEQQRTTLVVAPI